MKIIPVIDLKDGCVVHARHGDRNNYQPLNTPLCSSSSLFDVVDAFLSLHCFDTFYLADLNAIMGYGNHQELINQIADNFKHIDFWLDNGCRLSELSRQHPKNITPVIGSESQQEINFGDQKDFILSLDFQAEQRLGSHLLFDTPALWPQNIIIMTLAKVGSGTGPDFAKLREYRQKHPDKNFIAAGGVRNAHDLYRLQASGIDRALVASALHSGAITTVQIKNLQAKKYPE